MPKSTSYSFNEHLAHSVGPIRINFNNFTKWPFVSGSILVIYEHHIIDFKIVFFLLPLNAGLQILHIFSTPSEPELLCTVLHLSPTF